MNEIDHIGQRVMVGSIVGGFGGCISALYNGKIILRTSALAFVSCSLTATACFGCERIANIVITNLLSIHKNTNNANDDNNDILLNNKKTTTTTTTTLLQSPKPPNFEQMILSHTLGGIMGGGISGMLYIGRPLRGVAFLTPIMMIIGYGEYLFQDLHYNNNIHNNIHNTNNNNRKTHNVNDMMK